MKKKRFSKLAVSAQAIRTLALREILVIVSGCDTTSFTTEMYRPTTFSC